MPQCWVESQDAAGSSCGELTVSYQVYRDNEFMYEDDEYNFDHVLSYDFGTFYVADPFSLTSDDIGVWSVTMQVGSHTYPDLIAYYEPIMTLSIEHESLCDTTTEFWIDTSLFPTPGNTVIPLDMLVADFESYFQFPPISSSVGEETGNYDACGEYSDVSYEVLVYHQDGTEIYVPNWIKVDEYSL